MIVIKINRKISGVVIIYKMTGMIIITNKVIGIITKISRKMTGRVIIIKKMIGIIMILIMIDNNKIYNK